MLGCSMICYTAKKLPLWFIGALTVMLVILLQVRITQYYMMYRKANMYYYASLCYLYSDTQPSTVGHPVVSCTSHLCDVFDQGSCDRP